MSTLNIKTIRDSFELARPHVQGIVSRFYEILWRDFPASQAIFAQVDMEQQKNALIGSLSYIVNHLDGGESLVQYLRKMGARHVNYGVQDEHYGMVGEALLKTFAEAFGDAWTADLAEQWTLAVGFIAEQMKEGAAAVGARPLATVEPLPPRESKAKPNKEEKFELPAEVRQEIKKQVRSLIQEAIQNEIQSCIQEELATLKQASVSELIRKRA